MAVDLERGQHPHAGRVRDVDEAQNGPLPAGGHGHVGGDPSGAALVLVERGRFRPRLGRACQRGEQEAGDEQLDLRPRGQVKPPDRRPAGSADPWRTVPLTPTDRATIRAYLELLRDNERLSPAVRDYVRRLIAAGRVS